RTVTREAGTRGGPASCVRDTSGSAGHVPAAAAEDDTDRAEQDQRAGHGGRQRDLGAGVRQSAEAVVAGALVRTVVTRAGAVVVTGAGPVLVRARTVVTRTRAVVVSGAGAVVVTGPIVVTGPVYIGPVATMSRSAAGHLEGVRDRLLTFGSGTEDQLERDRLAIVVLGQVRHGERDVGHAGLVRRRRDSVVHRERVGLLAVDEELDLLDLRLVRGEGQRGQAQLDLLAAGERHVRVRQPGHADGPLGVVGRELRVGGQVVGGGVPVDIAGVVEVRALGEDVEPVPALGEEVDRGD